MYNLSIFQNLKRSQITNSPYAHAYMEKCLPNALYEELSESYPNEELIHNLNLTYLQKYVKSKYTIGENTRNDLSAILTLNHGQSNISRLWTDFVAYHASSAFMDEVLFYFEESILQIYPHLKSEIDDFKRGKSVGIRFDPESDHEFFSLDCQIGVNTPSKKKSSVRGPHTDATDEIYAGLLYFRLPEDKTNGGNLEIFNWKDTNNPVFVGEAVRNKHINFVREYKYAPNTLVFFINSAFAVHSVSPRDPSPLVRRLVNIIGRTYNKNPEGLFVKHQSSIIDKVLYKSFG